MQQHFLLSGDAEGVIILWEYSLVDEKVVLCLLHIPLLSNTTPAWLILFFFSFFLIVEICLTSATSPQKRCYLHHSNHGVSTRSSFCICIFWWHSERVGSSISIYLWRWEGYIWIDSQSAFQLLHDDQLINKKETVTWWSMFILLHRRLLLLFVLKFDAFLQKL